MASDPDDGGAARSLNRSALALHANTVISSALGFAFLVLAANLYEEERLGRDMALVSAMMLIAAIAELNIGMSLPRFLPRLGPRSARTVINAYLASSAVAVVLAIGFVVLAPRLSDSLSFLGGSLGLGAIFVVSVVLWNIFAVQDSILTAVRRASWVPVENGVFGLLKIVLMVVWANSAVDHGVFFAWVLPMVVMVVPITGALFGIAIPAHVKSSPAGPADDELSGRRQLAKYLGLDYLASLLVQGATSVLPLVVVVLLGTVANASFSIAFTIVTAVEQLALNVGLSLTVESSTDRSKLAALTRHSVLRFGALLSVLVLGGIALTPLVLWPFGEPYTDTVPTVLRLLLLGCIPQALVVLYQAVERIRGHAWRIVYSTVAQMVAILTGVIALAPSFGLAGVGWGWVIGHTVVGIAVLPSLWRVMFPSKVVTAS